MKEFLRALVQSKRTRVGAVVATLGLSSAACAEDITASSVSLNVCSHLAIYDAKGSDQAVNNPSQLVRQAQQDVSTLRRRSQSVNGSIDLPRYQQVTEIVSTADSLTLYFPGNNAGNDPDTALFNFVHNQPVIGLGAIACTSGSNGNIYPNVLYTSLQEYVQETASLDN